MTEAQQLKNERERLTAELMVSLALKSDLKTVGQIHFDCGNLTYNLLTDSSVNSKKTNQSVSKKDYLFDVFLKDGTNFEIKN